MYCEKLSEQLTAVDNAAAVSTTTGTTTVTGTAIDGSNYNRLIALSRVTGVTAATGTWQIQWQASVVSGFTGTATTVQTCTGGITGGTAAAVTAVQHCEIAGEDVQSARAANDRYVRAVLTLTSGSAACTA
ncbi:MAG: hypothetical protein P8124_14085, partial [Gammaproteobacteria bacterium]